MKGYRYEIVDNGKHCGFLTALDDYFNIDEIIDLCWFFEEKLPLPTIEMTNTVSYFTKSGNRTFHKAINKAKKAFLEKGLEFICIEKEITDNIFYTDKYQIIIGQEFESPLVH